MSKKRNEGGSKAPYQLLMFAIAMVITLLCVGSSIYTPDTEAVQVGDVATKRYVSPSDTVDEVATERLKTAAANSVGPIYKIDSTVEETSTRQVSEVFQELNDILLTLASTNASTNTSANEESEAPTQTFQDKVNEASLTLPVVLTSRQLSAFESLPRATRIMLAEDCVDMLNQVYSEGISADELDSGKEMLQVAISKTVWSGDIKSLSLAIASAALEPNLVLDEDAMQAEREQKRSEVNNVVILQNQKIIDEGEIITQDIYDKLVALNLVVNDDITQAITPIFGSIILLSLLFGAVYLLFIWTSRGSFMKENEQKMLFVIFILNLLIVRVMKDLGYYPLIPVGLFAMLVSLLIGRRMALMMNIFFCVICSLFFQDHLNFLVFGLLSGSFGALLIQKSVKRAQMIPVALAMAAINALIIVGISLFNNFANWLEIGIYAGLGAVLGLLMIVIAIGSLPFWESVFEVNTSLRLLEFTNPNNELLRRLMIEAPGTYHHSLIVANLAETAVYEIGGNTALARAGAYYHDIGKLKYPVFFSENQSGHNPHDSLEAKASARIITQHTKYGEDLGIANNLPTGILNIIKEHHGNSLVKFFYFKALKTYGADNVEEKDYRYQGQIPTSRESAVVMLADTVEAAVRAMLGSGKTLAEAETAIHTLIKDKLDDGQLNQSGLAIHELELIGKAFIKVFHGMYHERVSYPKPEDISAASKKTIEEKKEITSDNSDR